MPRPELRRLRRGVVAAPHVELIEELEGGLARLPTPTHASSSGWGASDGPPIAPRTLAPRGSPRHPGDSEPARLLDELRHLQRGRRGFLSAIAHRAARARPGLFLGVGRDDPEGRRHPRRQRDVANASRRLPGHVLEVRSLPADHHAHADDGRVAAGRGQMERGQGQLERARDPVQLHGLVGHLGRREGVARSLHEAGHDGLVEAGGHDGEARRLWRPGVARRDAIRPWLLAREAASSPTFHRIAWRSSAALGAWPPPNSTGREVIPASIRLGMSQSGRDVSRCPSLSRLVLRYFRLASLAGISMGTRSTKCSP